MQQLIHLHGGELGLGADGRLICPAGFLTGADGVQFAHAAPTRAVLLDDFLGKTISGVWGVEKGSDAGAANYAINPAIDGTARGVTGAGAGATMAINGVQLDSELNWAATQGGLDMQVRLKVSSVASFAIFVGFTNQKGTLQMPVLGSGAANGLTENANDCVGFLYDSAMSTNDWWMVGNAAGVAAAAQDSGTAPVAATYDVLRVELSKSSGMAKFFRNGVQLGLPMAGPITYATALTPVVAAFARAAASVNIDVDYVQVSQQR